MNISAAGLALIASFEGFSATPYNDPAGNATVGYGELLHLGPCTADELAQPPITEAEGQARLAVKVQPYGDAVEQNSRTLNQNEYDALCSFTYNIGISGYIQSSVRAAVNGLDGGNVCFTLRQYVHGSDGVIYPGLVRRREAECALFMTPWEDAMTQAELDRLANVEVQVYKTRLDLNALANGQDALPPIKGMLRYLWALASKPWPF
jgi:GH24 family phage-related lysozyme (muramidase)